MLFTHNNRYLPLTGLLTYFKQASVLPEKNTMKFLKYLRNISKISRNFTLLFIMFSLLTTCAKYKYRCNGKVIATSLSSQGYNLLPN